MSGAILWIGIDDFRLQAHVRIPGYSMAAPWADMG